MNQGDQNINKDMIDSDLIDLESLDFSNDQTWLYRVPNDSGKRVDIVDWHLSCEWPHNDDPDYLKTEAQFFAILDNILKNDAISQTDKSTFDSRTYVKPKKRVQRPSLHTMVEGITPNSPSIAINLMANQAANKYMTYNKYSTPLGPISPMLRLKTFNVDTNSDNSGPVKEYAQKRRSLVQDDDPQLEDIDVSERLSVDQVTPSKPINIDFSQPAHNLHNTFNRGLPTIVNERGSLNMYQSGESLMRMSPPSLVSSLLMDNSGTFNQELLDNKRSFTSHKDSGVATSGRESMDPMMTSMTLSILDEKDMSTSFLSQTTYPDHDSLIDSLPPSLVSSVNSSYVISNTPKPKESPEQNVFSSATFTHLEQSERLLMNRPRCQPYNSLKRDSLRSSDSYTKSKEESVQNDTFKVLNENSDKNSSKTSNAMSETVTVHYANNKFRSKNAEKENLNSSFERSDAFYKDVGIQKPIDLGKNSLNVTLDKQELNEIIQARQKLSLARKTLPIELESTNLPNQIDIIPNNQTIMASKQNMENASELITRRRMVYEKNEGMRDTPKRNATFKKMSPKSDNMDTTVVYVNEDNNKIIDINLATTNLLESGDRTLQEEDWAAQTRAMVGSSESTDTPTFSSSSPPDSVPDTAPADPRSQVASTPLAAFRQGTKTDLLDVHHTISPIYDIIDDKSYILTNNNSKERKFDHNQTVINSATIVRKSPNVKRDILAAKGYLEGNKLSPPKSKVINRTSPTHPAIAMMPSPGPPPSLVRRSGLPASKLRQYGSHKELSRIPATNAPTASALPSRGVLRRPVYASNPVLSPTATTAPNPLNPLNPPIRRDSYTVAVDEHYNHTDVKEKAAPRPALVRQGTETLRRDRPLSQLLPPRDLRGTHTTIPVPMRTNHSSASNGRPYSIAGTAAPRASRPASVPLQRPAIAPPPPVDPRPLSTSRPSRLPAPRRTLRPPSVYSVAPASDYDHY